MYRKWDSILHSMAQNKCHGCIKLEEHIQLAKEIKQQKNKVNQLMFQMSDQALQQMPEFLSRVYSSIVLVCISLVIRFRWHFVASLSLLMDRVVCCAVQINVLKEVGCIDADLVVQIKGRVACEMNSGEELICTECLFENQLETLEPEEAVALMSAFVFQQKNTSEPSLTPKLQHAKHRFLFSLHLWPLYYPCGINILKQIRCAWTSQVCDKHFHP